LPNEQFFGVGKVTSARLKGLELQTGADLKRLGEERLRNLLGKHGGQLYIFARGEDERPVEPVHERKSLGTVVTIERDIRDPKEMKRILEHLAMHVERRLVELGITGKTLTLKVRRRTLGLTTRASSRSQGFQLAQEMLSVLRTQLS
jgi:DNA polymerase IV